MMKEVIDLELLQEAHKVIALFENESKNSEINAVHCSWCTNCAGIVGD